MLLLVDVDDSVLQFIKPFNEWMKEKGYTEHTDIMDTYSVMHAFNISIEEASNLIKEYAETVMAHEQEPEPCAKIVLPRLYKKGHRFVAITACGIDEDFKQKRLNILEKTFGFEWNDIHTVDFHASKEEYLFSYDKSIWVEDNLRHAVDGVAIGHHTFLLDRPYNQGKSDGIVRVKDWYEIERNIECMEI